MRKEALAILTGAVVLLALGCGSEPEMIHVDWECDEGTYQLALDREHWKVGETDDGGMDFQSLDHEDFAFSASKWEDLSFGDGFNFEGYYEYFAEELKGQYPDAEETGMEVTTVQNMTIMEMGVRFYILDTPYQITSTVVHAAECEDTLNFVFIYPIEGNEDLAAQFDGLVAGVSFKK
ncbi:MAG: hypothetical protein IJ374_04085 [Lachnospiraceae bacterium]|nr:hypothetical protein [Lachnospiraceae bacterium]